MKFSKTLDNLVVLILLLQIIQDIGLKEMLNAAINLSGGKKGNVFLTLFALFAWLCLYWQLCLHFFKVKTFAVSFSCSVVCIQYVLHWNYCFILKPNFILMFKNSSPAVQCACYFQKCKQFVSLWYLVESITALDWTNELGTNGTRQIFPRYLPCVMLYLVKN